MGPNTRAEYWGVGPPTRATLRALAGIQVHRTDLEGTVSADAAPQGITVTAR